MIREKMIEVIKSQQIDIGHHVTGDMKVKKIKQCCNVFLEDTADAILKLIDDELPKEKDVEATRPRWYIADGYNQAIREMREKLK